MKKYVMLIFILSLISMQMFSQRIDKDLYYKKGIQLLENELYDSAIYYFSRVIQIDSLFYDGYFYRGNAYLKKIDPDKAILDYNFILRHNTHQYNKEIIYNRGLANYLAGKDYEAFVDFRSVIYNDSSFYRAYNSRGRVYLRMKEFDKAIKDFNDAIKRDSLYADAFANRGEVKMYQNDLTSAINDCNKAIQLNEREAWYYEIRGRVKLKLKDYEGAVNDFYKALNLNSNIVVVYPFLIEALSKLGEHAKLVQIYDLLIESNSTVWEWYLARGESKVSLNDKGGACEDFFKAMDNVVLEEDNKIRKKADKQIKRKLKGCKK